MLFCYFLYKKSCTGGPECTAQHKDFKWGEWAQYGLLLAALSMAQALSCELADNELAAYRMPVWLDKYQSPSPFCPTPHGRRPRLTEVITQVTPYLHLFSHTRVVCAWPSSRLFTEAQDPISAKWNKLLMLVFMNNWCTFSFFKVCRTERATIYIFFKYIACTLLKIRSVALRCSGSLKLHKSALSETLLNYSPPNQWNLYRTTTAVNEVSSPAYRKPGCLSARVQVNIELGWKMSIAGCI